MSRLGQYYDRAKPGPEAAALYCRALKLNPSEPTAAALARYPRLNLALAQSQRGDRAAARATLLRLLRFHPGNAQARELLSRLPP